jgi:hypothetical protein
MARVASRSRVPACESISAGDASWWSKGAKPALICASCKARRQISRSHYSQPAISRPFVNVDIGLGCPSMTSDA